MMYNYIRYKLEEIMAKVIIYSTPWCAFCKTEKEWLDSLGVPYTSKDIEVDPANKSELIEKVGEGFKGVPVTDVDGEIVLGFDREKLRKLLGISQF